MERHFGPGVDELWRKKSGRKRIRLTNNPEILQKLGEAEKFYVQGDNPQAIRILSEITKAAPRLEEPYKILALIYEQLGLEPQVLQLYAVAASLNSRNAKLWWKVYYYGVRLKEYDQAGIAIARTIALEKDKKIYQQERLALCIRTGNLRTMRELFRSYKKTYPSDTLIYLYLGDLLYDHYSYHSAFHFYEQFLLQFFPHQELFQVVDGDGFTASSNPTTSTSLTFATLFIDRNQIEKILYHFINIIYCLRRMTKLLFEMNDFSRVVLLIENFFIFFHQSLVYYEEHLTDFELPRLNERISNEGEEEEDPIYDQLIPEEFPLDLLLLLGLVKLFTAIHDEEINQALTILNPLLSTLQQNFSILFPTEIHIQIPNTLSELPWPATEIEPNSNPTISSHAMEVEPTNLETTTTAAATMALEQEKVNTMFRLNQQFYDISLEEEQEEEKRGMIHISRGGDEIPSQQRNLHYRNVYKEEERIRFHIISYLIMIASLLMEMGMKNRGKKLLRLITDHIITMDYLLIEPYSNLLTKVAYELQNNDEILLAYEVLVRATEVSPYSLVVNVAFARVLYSLSSMEQGKEIIVNGLLHLDQVIQVIMDDIDLAARKMTGERALEGGSGTQRSNRSRNKEKSDDDDEDGDGNDDEEEDNEDDENDEKEDFMDEIHHPASIRTTANDMGLPIYDDDGEDDAEENDDRMDIDDDGGNDEDQAMEDVLGASFFDSTIPSDEKPMVESNRESAGHVTASSSSVPSSSSAFLLSKPKAIYARNNSLLEIRKKMIQFPLVSNHSALHRYQFYQMLELLCFYLLLIPKAPTTSYPTHSSLPWHRYDFVGLKLTILEALLRGSKSRLKTRDLIRTKVMIRNMHEIYCRNTLFPPKGTSHSINDFEVINTLPTAKKTQNECINRLLEEAIAVTTITNTTEELLLPRFYALIMFLSEYIAIDQFFPREILIDYLHNLPEEVVIVVDHHLQSIEEEVSNELSQLLKLYDTFVPYNPTSSTMSTIPTSSTRTEKKPALLYFTTGYGLQTFYQFFHQILLKQLQATQSLRLTGDYSLATTTSNATSNTSLVLTQAMVLQQLHPKFSFIYPQNTHNFSIAYLQDRYHPLNSTSQTGNSASNTAPTLLEQALLNNTSGNFTAFHPSFLSSSSYTHSLTQFLLKDPSLNVDLQLLRANHNIRQFRGRIRKHSYYDDFLATAERISPECKQYAEQLYQHPEKIASYNYFYQMIIQHTIQEYQKQQQQTMNIPDPSRDQIPFPRYLKSLYLENIISMRAFLSSNNTENETTNGTGGGGSGAFIPYYLVGNEFAILRRHNEVIEHYMKAFLLDQNQPLIALCLAAYLIMLSSHPLSKDRMNLLMKGYGFLCLYQDLRLGIIRIEKGGVVKKQKDQPIHPMVDKSFLQKSDSALLEKENEIRYYQETLYNIGRSYHEIKFYHLATYCYQRCLQLADEYDFLRYGGTNGSASNNHRQETGYRSVTLESAHNLVIIYRHSKSKEMAFHIMRKYLTFF